ncbi:hypothetical protein [Vibrio intestinalis]|uniref:hypothetical protein n=1 Tax=Vibrio intestinalis TaxID=2933291 RepID=UPI0021A451AE|nr:hypothetical protein [Vibrio intestinalis]
MTDDTKQKVKQLLIATKYGVSASEMPTIIQVPEHQGLAMIQQLIEDGEDIHSLGAEENPAEFVLYSIGPIDESIG